MKVPSQFNIVYRVTFGRGEAQKFFFPCHSFALVSCFLLTIYLKHTHRHTKGPLTQEKPTDAYSEVCRPT